MNVITVRVLLALLLTGLGGPLASENGANKRLKVAISPISSIENPPFFSESGQ